MQNSSPNQMKLLTTRIGINSKMVITGDLNQTDITTINGLQDFLNRLYYYKSGTNTTMDSIKVVTFEKHDIERSEIVKNIINIYDYDKSNNTSSSISSSSSKKKLDKVNPVINSNDAALIPKHHISKNVDIFWDTNF